MLLFLSFYSSKNPEEKIVCICVCIDLSLSLSLSLSLAIIINSLWFFN